MYIRLQWFSSVYKLTSVCAADGSLHLPSGLCCFRPRSQQALWSSRLGHTRCLVWRSLTGLFALRSLIFPLKSSPWASGAPPLAPATQSGITSLLFPTEVKGKSTSSHLCAPCPSGMCVCQKGVRQGDSVFCVTLGCDKISWMRRSPLTSILPITNAQPQWSV